MEQILDWLNENELRAFPFLESCDRKFSLNSITYTLPDNFLLDLQLIVPSINIAQGSGVSIPMYLKRIAYSAGNYVHIDFGTSNTTITTFSINLSEQPHYPIYLRNSDGNLAVFGAGLDFLASLNTTNFEIQTNFYVEPSTYLQFNGAWLGVSSIQVAPEKITEQESYAPLLPLQNTQQPTRLTGDIKLLPGYNFRVDIYDGLIDLEVGTNYGLRMNCSTSFLQPQYLDCSELVSYINGVPPDADGNFTISAGSNIDIVSGNTIAPFSDPLTESANSHTLFIGLSFQSTDLCAPVNVTPSPL